METGDEMWVLYVCSGSERDQCAATRAQGSVSLMENVTSSEMVIALYKCACYKYQFIGNRTLESPDMMLHNMLI